MTATTHAANNCAAAKLRSRAAGAGTGAAAQAGGTRWPAVLDADLDAASGSGRQPIELKLCACACNRMRRRGVDRLMPPNSAEAPASLFKLPVCLCGIYQSPPAAKEEPGHGKEGLASSMWASCCARVRVGVKCCFCFPSSKWKWNYLRVSRDRLPVKLSFWLRAALETGTRTVSVSATATATSTPTATGCGINSHKSMDRKSAVYICR